MTELSSLPDSQSRRLAATTFDRNVVVIAGAGTGKTTLLVNRFIHALMHEPSPATITQVVALTFTNKAATEMKGRLRVQLAALADSHHSLTREENSGLVSITELQEHYHLSSAQVSERAKAALLDLEKAQIGTLHSFAAHLLRLNPIESRVDPLFQEDDGSQFENYFDQEWEFWLDRELGAHGADHSRWRALIADLGLTSIRQLAFALCSEMVPLDELRHQLDGLELPKCLREWLMAQHTSITALLVQHEGRPKRKIESGLGRAQEVFNVILNEGWNPMAGLNGQVGNGLDLRFGRMPNGWDEHDFLEARRVISVANALLSVDRGLIQELFHLVFPFVHRIREGFSNEGLITFDGLLARANALLRHHPSVRERLKKDYKAILVDEFQDTDPVQYEIVLYLAERAGSWSPGWKEVDLTPGKLFIVGDPKQSIYAFRRADLEAFEQVVQKVRDSGGMVCELSTNFRSHEKVLEVINAIFGRVLQPVPNIQPPNVHLIATPNRRGGVTRPGVEFHIVKMDRKEEEAFDSAAATRLEAEQLACWIKEDLLARETLIDGNGQQIPLQPGHIGLLLRKLTQAQDYLDALRRHGIRYITDGEKHFYRRQEVIDFINLLRVVENPSDTIALVGLLRSSLGALTDKEIYELYERGALGCRQSDRLENWESPKVEGIRRLYSALNDLSRVALTYTIPSLIDVLFARIPVLELAVASLHGDQAVANLLKFRELARRVADCPHLSLTGFIDHLGNQMSELKTEAEAGGAEESLDAVRVLTVHKAKGLEFPVVILPGLHHGTNLGNGASPVAQDWTTGTVGISVGERCTLGAVLVREKFRMKEQAEQRRLLYVAMTRAKDRLILSGGIPDHHPKGTFLSLLQEAADTDIGCAEIPQVQFGLSSSPQSVISRPDQYPGNNLNRSSRKLKDAHDLDRWLEQWDSRERCWASAASQTGFVTPTSLLEPITGSGRPAGDGLSTLTRGRVIGSLVHRVLEAWDFASDFGELRGIVERLCQRALTQDMAQEVGEVQEELLEIFKVFLSSEPYHRLRRATILGREVPFVVPWDCSRHANQAINNRAVVMEGVIDLVYNIDGQMWIADYKTDHLNDAIPGSLGTKHESQARIYREAAAHCLGLNHVGCQLLFVRHGKSIEL